MGGDLMSTMFRAMTLTNGRGIVCEPKAVAESYDGPTLTNPCGLTVHLEEMGHPNDLSHSELGRIYGAHIHAHFLDAHSEYDSAGEPYTFSFEIHESSGEILGVSPIGGPGPLPW